MNIGIFKRPRIATILTTMYFAGVLASASMPDYRIVAATFFVGFIAIYFTARSKEEVVVYLERKAETVIEQKIDNGHSQLDGEAIKEIIKGNIDVPQLVLNEICNKLGAGQGAIYVESQGEYELKFGYAIPGIQSSYKLSEGLVGRVAAEGKCLYLDALPENYITVFSGLGNASPRRLALIPIESGVIEIATFTDLNATTLKHIQESCSGLLK